MRVILFSLFCLVIESRAEFEPCTRELIVKSVEEGKLVCNLTSRSDIDRCKGPFEHLELKSNGRSGRCQSSEILVFDTPSRLTADSVANKLISTSDRLLRVQDLATLIDSLQVLPSKYPNQFVLSQAVGPVEPTTTFTVRGTFTDDDGLCRLKGKYINKDLQHTWAPEQCCGSRLLVCRICRECERIPWGIKPDKHTKRMVILEDGKYMCQGQGKGSEYFWSPSDCGTGAFLCRTCVMRPAGKHWRIIIAIVGIGLLCVVTYGLASALAVAAVPAAAAGATAIPATVAAGSTAIPYASLGTVLGPGAFSIGAVGSAGPGAATIVGTGLTVTNVPATAAVALGGAAVGRRLLSGDNNTNNNNDLSGVAVGRRLLSGDNNTNNNNDLSFLDRTTVALAEEANLVLQLDEFTGDALLQCSNDDIPIYQDFVQKITEDLVGEDEYAATLAAADFSAQGLSDGCFEAVSRHWELKGDIEESGAQIVVPTASLLVTVSAILVFLRAWRW